MQTKNLTKTLAAAATIAVGALAATPLAQAGLGMPQKHPDGLGMPQKRPHGLGMPQKQTSIIGVLNHPDIIAILKRAHQVAPARDA
jgi:Spy/CpxP family protein refolding chaperone